MSMIEAAHDTVGLASLLEAAPDAMLLVDPSGRIVLVNREVERLFGYSRQELLGSALETLVPSASAAPIPRTGPSTRETRRPGPWAPVSSSSVGRRTAASSPPRSASARSVRKRG